jgi:hypothetical protein
MDHRRGILGAVGRATVLVSHGDAVSPTIGFLTSIAADRLGRTAPHYATLENNADRIAARLAAATAPTALIAGFTPPHLAAQTG